MVTEFKVTKAPKKTLAALVRFARVRFKKVALILDGFEEWERVAPEIRSLIVGNLSEIRWALDKDAVMVFLIGEGTADELAEQFAGGTQLEWDMPGVERDADTRDTIDVAIIDGWLADAAAPGATPITMADPVLTGLAAASTTMTQFAEKAANAIENAAERGVSALDDAALTAGQAVGGTGGND